MENPQYKSPLRRWLFDTIFGTETRAGKNFDVALLWMILASILLVVLESVEGLQSNNKRVFFIFEWIFTGFFTIEYFTRIYCHPTPKKYIFSFYGIIDFLAILPGYISLILVGPQFFLVIRVIRLLRVFRIFKLTRYLDEAYHLGRSLKASLYKITIFFGVVLSMVLVLGSLMYFIEGAENGFSSIPQSMYWAIVTITTVGYGDIAPQTNLGKLFASLVMILGYTIIAVPTGIVTSELTKASQGKKTCPRCRSKVQQSANYCSTCGYDLNADNEKTEA